MPAGDEDRASEAGRPPPGVVDIEERTWLPRHARGDGDAFTALIQAYRRPVYSYLVRAGVLAAEREVLLLVTVADLAQG